MLKKILAVFLRDLKVSLRDFIALYIIIFPLLFAVAINLFTPGINDTTVNLVLLDQNVAGQQISVPSDAQQSPLSQQAFFEQLAAVTVVESVEALEARVLKRDHAIGITGDGLVVEGDEPEYLVDYAKLLNVFYEKGASTEATHAELKSLGRVLPPIKTIFVNGAMMLIAVLGGMLIALNIVEEKADNTISAMHVTPISRFGYIVGKSLIGMVVPAIGTILMLLLTGYGAINMLQMLMMLLTTAIISMLVGFVEGLANDDVMNAAGNMKLLFLPLLGAIAGAELLADKWQPFFYWIPFYWSYKGNLAVLSGTGTWSEVGIYSGLVLALSTVVFILLAPKIRKGLE